MQETNQKKHIEPWPPPEGKEHLSSTPFSGEWEEFVDYLPWTPGKMYRAIKMITASTLMPEKDVDDERGIYFFYSPDVCCEKQGLTKEQYWEATSTSQHIASGDIFMLIEGHYDDFVFSILHKNKVKYISRQHVNAYRCVEVLYDPPKEI